MPHFMIVLILYINLLDKKFLFLRNNEPLKHAQNKLIHSILHMEDVLSGHCFPLKYSAVSYDSVSDGKGLDQTAQPGLIWVHTICHSIKLFVN